MTDNDIRGCAQMAMYRGGSFVHAIGEAVIQADDTNYQLIKPFVLKLLEKYPKYLEWYREDLRKDSLTT